METLKKQFSLILLVLISSILSKSVKAQYNQLLASQPNQITILDHVNDNTEEIQDSYQEPRKFKSLEPLNETLGESEIMDDLLSFLDNTLEINGPHQESKKLSILEALRDEPLVESEVMKDLHSNLNEVDLFLVLNELESIEVELWSEDKKLLIDRECRFGDEFISECIEEIEGGYSLVLKSKNKVTISR